MAQLNEAKKAAGSARVDPALPNRIADSAAAADTSLMSAQRDNDTVYLQRVPKVDQVVRWVADLDKVLLLCTLSSQLLRCAAVTWRSCDDILSYLISRGQKNH